MNVQQSIKLIALILIVVAMSSGAEARSEFDFHGRLIACANHPPVNLTGFGSVYAYEPDLTQYVEGNAKLDGKSVTLSFPRRFASFTITMKAGKFYVGKVQCDADNV